MKNRKEILKHKAKELEKELGVWAKTQNLLQEGELLQFKIAIVHQSSIQGSVSLPEDESKTAETFTVKPAILKKSVHDLGLSGRSLNLLLNNGGCLTVGDFLSEQKYNQFGKWRNAGPVSYREIQEAFQKIGVVLPWSVSLYRNPFRKTLQQLEDEQVQVAEIKKEDWEKIFSIRWEPYQLPTIKWFRNMKMNRRKQTKSSSL